MDRFCTNCVFSSDEGNTVGHRSALWACRNVEVGSVIDFVDGKRLLVDCHKARSADGKCGQYGRYWEARAKS